MVRRFFFVLMIVATVLISACVGEKKTPAEISTEPPELPAVEIQEPPPFEGVDKKIARYLNDGTDYSVFLAYPQKTEEIFLYNYKPMRSASMIKVFIMAAVMDKVKRDELSLDEQLTLNEYDKVGGAGIIAGYYSGMSFSLRDVMELMITYSDNTATNMIIDRLGMEAINDYIQREGYTDTALNHKMMLYSWYAGDNMSSVRDLGNFFLKLYHYDCCGEKYDKIMLDILAAQTDTDCFPAALPNVQVAHKTGALDELYDDGGIIYSPKGHAVIVIMTDNCVNGEYGTIEQMKNFVRAVVKI